MQREGGLLLLHRLLALLCSWFIASRVMPGLEHIWAFPKQCPWANPHQPCAYGPLTGTCAPGKARECNALFAAFQSYEMVHFHHPSPLCRNPELAPGLALSVSMAQAKAGQSRKCRSTEPCAGVWLLAGLFFSTSLCKRFPSPKTFYALHTRNHKTAKAAEEQLFKSIQCSKQCSQPSSPSVTHCA